MAQDLLNGGGLSVSTRPYKSQMAILKGLRDKDVLSSQSESISHVMRGLRAVLFRHQFVVDARRNKTVSPLKTVEA
jgi:hypothetical protein